jgi:hypothetical protein
MPTPKKKKLKDAFLIWGVPPEVKKKFKAACARKDVSMREALIALLKKGPLD